MSGFDFSSLTIGNQQVSLSLKSQIRLREFLVSHEVEGWLSSEDQLIYDPNQNLLSVTIKKTHRKFLIIGKAFSSIYSDLVKQTPHQIHSMSEMHASIQDTAYTYQRIVHPRLQPGYAGQAILLAATGADALSFFRNAFGVQIGWEQIIRHMGVGGGSLSFGLSAIELHNARREREAALAVQHNESRLKATAKIVGAAIGLIASLFYVLGKFNELSWVTLSFTTVTALSIVSTSLWGIGAIVAIALASLGIYRCRVFDQRIQAFGTDEEGLKKALAYLLSEVSVSQAEKNVLRREELNGISDEALNRKVEELRARKIKHVKTRLSLSAVRMIIDRAPEILESFSQANPSAVSEAKKLLLDIRFEGNKKKIVYAIGLIASVIGFVGIVLSCFASAGIVPIALFAVSAAISFGVTLANWLAPLRYSTKAPAFYPLAGRL